MTEDSKDGVFSDAYWNMHRNSLIFSFICILFSHPGVTIGGALPALAVVSISQASVPFIVLSSLTVAFYSLAVFTLEWRQQALPYLQSRYSMFRSKAKEDSDDIQIIGDFYRDKAKDVAYCKATLAAMHEQQTKYIAERPKCRDDVKLDIDNLSDQAREEFDKALNSWKINQERAERYRLQNPSRTHLAGFIPPNDAIQQAAESAWNSTHRSLSHSVATIEGRLQTILSAIDDSYFKSLDQKAIASLSSFASDLDRVLIESPEAGFRAWLLWKHRRMQRTKAMDVTRIVGVGLLLPVLIFATALAHFVGRFWFQMFSSFLP